VKEVFRSSLNSFERNKRLWSGRFFYSKNSKCGRANSLFAELAGKGGFIHLIYMRKNKVGNARRMFRARFAKQIRRLCLKIADILPYFMHAYLLEY